MNLSPVIPKDVRSYMRLSFLWVAPLLLGMASGNALRHQIARQAATLDIEALITKGTTFQVFYNNEWTTPQRVPIRPNVWSHYQFTVPPQIVALRLDPSDEANAKAYIRSIVLTTRDGKNSKSVDVSQLKNWIGWKVRTLVQPVDHSILLITDAPSGYLMGGITIQAANALPFLRSFHLDAQTLLWCLLVAGVLFLSVGIKRDTAATFLFVFSLFICVIFIAEVSAKWLLKLRGSLPPVAHAVGVSAYAALSKSGELISVNLAIGIACIFFLAAGLYWRWKRNEPLSLRFASDGSFPVSRWYFVAILGLCALFAFPPAALYLAAATNVRHAATDFDSQNVFTWAFLVYQGKLPWRDFWFPYGGAYLRISPLYPDILYMWLYELILVGVLLWCALKIFRNRVAMVLGCCAFFFLLESAQMIVPLASPRYFLSLSLVLLTAVAIEEVSVPYFIFLGAWCTYVTSQEISQLVWASPACVLLIGLGIAASKSNRDRMRLTRNLLVGTAVATGILLVYFASLYHNSQLAGWWAFAKSLGEQADYGAWPAPIRTWLSANGGLATGLLACTTLLVIGGISNFIWPPDRRDTYYALPLSIGLLSWMIFQKQIIRSGIEAQVIAIPIFGLVLLLFQRTELSLSARKRIWLVFSTAFLFSCFILEAPTWASVLSQFRQARSFPQNLVALSALDKWDSVRRVYFSPTSLDYDGAPGTQLRDRFRAIAPTEPNESVYVLGNQPLLYILLEKPVPYFTNIYNESPIDSQHMTLSWLKQKRPKYVFWDAEAKDFDTVPNVVRIPIVFTYIIEHYRPVGSEGKYQVLKRLDSNEPPALSYWGDMLGFTINLGYVPAASSLSEAETGSTRAPVLIVRTFSPRDGQQLSVHVEAGANNYNILFSERADRQNYVIRLDRIPQIEAERAAGGALRIVGPPDSSFQANIRKLPIPVDDLY